MSGLSKSTLEIFLECPKCFWLAKNAKLERPRNPMPGILNAIDGLMKDYVIARVLRGEPVQYLEGSSLIPHPDRGMVKKFGNWRTFQMRTVLEGTPVQAWGGIDDLLLDVETNKVSPWDFKSKAEAGDEEYTRKWYQLQADLYHLILEGNALDCSGFAYFTYVFPEAVEEGSMKFGYTTIQIESDPNRALQVVRDATLCLDGPIPEHSETCPTCLYIGKRDLARV